LRNRLVAALIVFLAVWVINFIIPRLEPGNFVATLSSRPDLTPEQREKLIELFGLNQSLWVQFLKYVQQTFGSFPPSFGVSFLHYPQTVWSVVSLALPWTLLLIVVSISFAWVFGVLLGTALAWWQGSKFDSFVVGASSFMWGVPSYWLGTILIYLFAIKVHLFPAALTGTGGTPLTILSHAFLPILTLVLLNLPINAMVVRNTMIDVMREDFMFAARARGIKLRTLMFGHAARNALLPSITNLALNFGAILSGAYLVEIIFSYPGMGYLIEQSALNRDYPVLEGVLFFSAIIVIVANLLGDLSYVFLDPRVEY